MLRIYRGAGKRFPRLAPIYLIPSDRKFRTSLDYPQLTPETDVERMA